MKDFSSATLLSIIALFVSVLSPVLAAFVAHLHERKMFDRKFYDQHRAEALERFLKSAGTIVTLCNDESFLEYRAAYGEALMYMDDSLRKSVSAFDVLIYTMFSENSPETESIALMEFKNICDALRENPPRLKNWCH